ncbi:MAG: GNAT family N-acetyltransferase [Clostridiales bacterium]|nr:GNAT family N-acetyltransferase [Clostridiales bacterium]
MIIKQITPETEYLANFTSAVAFEGVTDFVKSKEEALAAMKQAENAEADKDESENAGEDKDPTAARWGAFTDDMSECMATLWSTPFRVRFDHNVVFLGGIGGVSCLPHHREKGAVKAVMAAALKEDFRRGYAIDYLYPFSRAYYRQYGFENAVERRVYNIDFSAISALTKQPAVGTFEMVRPDSDYFELDVIASRAWEETNLSTCWLKPGESLKRSGGADKKFYIYIYRTDDGVGRGYIAFTGEDGLMNCVNDFGHPAGFVFDTADTFVQLLRFCARMFTSRYNSLKISIPGYVRPEALIPEMNNVSVRVDTQGMARIIDVRQVFEKLLYKGDGEVRVGVSDKLIDENNGIWHVVWKCGKPMTVEKTTDEPDIECGIGPLSVMAIGAVGTAAIRWLPGVKINGSPDLSGIFYSKESFVTSLF